MVCCFPSRSSSSIVRGGGVGAVQLLQCRGGADEMVRTTLPELRVKDVCWNCSAPGALCSLAASSTCFLCTGAIEGLRVIFSRYRKSSTSRHRHLIINQEKSLFYSFYCGMRSNCNLITLIKNTLLFSWRKLKTIQIFVSKFAMWYMETNV